MSAPPVSCIIPAYNEEKYIREIVKICSAHPFIKEVIVVNDGSSDKTYDVVKGIKGIKILNYVENKGKNYAIMVGLKSAKYKCIFTCDADLIGVTENNITELLRPVVDGTCDVTIAIIRSAPYAWKLIGLDYICGIRVFPRDIIVDINSLKSIPPYGIEVYLNKIMIEKKTRIKVVKWFNVKNPRKTVKYGRKGGLLGDMKMMMNIFQVIKPQECISQIFKMRNLRV